MENKVVDLTKKVSLKNGTKVRANNNTPETCRFKIEVTTLEGYATVTDTKEHIVYKCPMDKHRIFRNGEELIEQYVHTDGIVGCTNKGRFTMPRKLKFTVKDGKKVIRKEDVHQIAWSNLTGRGNSSSVFELE